MQRLLRPHPASPPSPIRKIRVDAARFVDGRLALTFMAEGKLTRTRIPAERASARADELWLGTCFEAFLRSPDAETYVELNFSPSTEWAAWRFEFYRSGMRQAEIDPPTVKTMIAGKYLAVVAAVALGPLTELVPWQTWEVGLAAVIEAQDGSVSHWALVHPPGLPDFHHRDCFAADLAPAATL
ncbi:MAG TPA: DOMON-like domain-containing protein [Allosphingosinicella sp.]|nr:DOMON-like domain-containing protein [Allosphingosinicella sp.]